MTVGPSFPERAESEFNYRGTNVAVRVRPGAVSNNGVEDYRVEGAVYGRGTDRGEEADKTFTEVADSEGEVEEVASHIVETVTEHIDEQAELCGSLQNALASACAPYEEGGDRHPSSSAE